MTARRLLIYPGGRKERQRKEGEGGKEKNENPRGFLPLPQERDTLVVVEGGHGTVNIGYSDNGGNGQIVSLQPIVTVSCDFQHTKSPFRDKRLSL